MKQVEVVAAVIVRLGFVFCARRGGPGESPESALRREIREELSLDIEVGNFPGRVDHPYRGFDVGPADLITG